MGCEPTHLDSHQHVHLKEPVRRIVIESAARLGIPVRECTGGTQYCGRFYGQSGDGWPFPEGIRTDAFLQICELLQEGVTELGCHPSEANEPDSMYSAERKLELDTLCDPHVRTALVQMNIRLCSFHDIAVRAAGVKR